MPSKIWCAGPTSSLRSRTAVAAVPVLAIMLGAAQPAHAQIVGHAPWCADMTVINGYYECQYATYAQCRARVWGVTNICFSNPWYVVARPVPTRARHIHR